MRTMLCATVLLLGLASCGDDKEDTPPAPTYGTCDLRVDHFSSSSMQYDVARLISDPRESRTMPPAGARLCETETVTSAAGTPWPLTSRT